MTESDPTDRTAARALAAAGMDAFEHDVVADRIHDTGELAARLDLPADQTVAAFESRIHPEDRDVRRSRVESCTPGSPRYRIRYRLSDAEGEWCWIEESGITRFDAAGRLVGVIGVRAEEPPRRGAEEELRRTHEALRASEQRLRLVQLAGRRLVATLDPDSLFEALRELISQEVSCDGMVVSRYDAATSEVRAVYLWSSGARHDPSTLPVLTIDLAGAGMQTEVLRSGEARIFSDVRARVRDSGRYYDVGADGRPRDLKRPDAAPPVARSAMMVPLKVEGRVVGVLQISSDSEGAFRYEHLGLLEALASPVGVAMRNAELYAMAQLEIAERRVAERESAQARDELERARQALESTVAERTASLQQKVKELEVLSYGISHDMRAPLRALAGYAHVLVEDHAESLDPVGRDYLVRIERAAARMDQLILDVFTYSRATADPAPLGPVDLQRLFEDVVAGDPALQPPHAEVSLASDLPAVQGNEALLLQVLANLLGNATKFVGPGVTPHVEVTAERLDGAVRIGIRDNGIGIPDDERARIFDLFGQAHAGQGFEGTGIGLAVAHKAIERMGGSIGVDSSPGSGSRFWFTLPVASSAVAASGVG